MLDSLLFHKNRHDSYTNKKFIHKQFNQIQGVTSSGHMTNCQNMLMILYCKTKSPTVQDCLSLLLLTWQLCCCPIICPDDCVNCCFCNSVTATWEDWEPLCVICVCCKGILHNWKGGLNGGNVGCMTVEACGSWFAKYEIGGCEICWTGKDAFGKFGPPMESVWSDTSLQQVKQKTNSQL